MKRQCSKAVIKGNTKSCTEGGKATHRVENYFLGAAREQFGSAMKLCAGHAREWNTLHPFGDHAVEYDAEAREDAKERT